MAGIATPRGRRAGVQRASAQCGERGRKIVLGFKHRLLLSHLVVVLLGAGLLGAWLYRSAEQRLVAGAHERLLDTARLLAQETRPSDLAALESGAAAGADAALQQRLLDVVAVNTDIAVAFVARRDGETPHWLLASDERSAEAHDSAHIPSNADELDLLRESQGAVVRQVGDGDSGGLEALAPIGKGTPYVIGARLKPGVVEEDLRLLRLSSLGAFLICMLAALVFSRVLAQRLHGRIAAIVARCRALANSEPLPATSKGHDEFETVIGEFDAMAERLRHSQKDLEQALGAVTDANRMLEQRVRDRTYALESATEKLKIEIESRVQIEALLAEAALTDPLTGLLNRRAMLEMLDQVVQPGVGDVMGIAVVLADIDHFKRINDNWGHGVGDQALVAVAQVLDTLQGDQHRQCARWGGEEFFWLLPGLRLAEACRRAEELRRRIAALELPISGLSLSVSIGVAEYLPGEPLEDCLRRCDAALYRAKDSGRNTVVAARGGMFATMS